MSLTQFSPKNLHGIVNYAYTIAGRDNKPKHALYVFDGGAYSKTLGGGYDSLRVSGVRLLETTLRLLFKTV